MKPRLLLVCILLCLTVYTYPKTDFKSGIQVKFNYNDIYPTPFLPDSSFQYHGFIYAGLTTSKYFGFNQVTFSATPGVLFYIDEDKRDFSLGSRGKFDKVVPSFFFRTLYFSIDSLIASFAVGKRPIQWGVGGFRQFAFFLNQEFAEEVLGYYNTELSFRHKQWFFSFGGAMDTTSVDLLLKPVWYSTWFYTRYDSKKMTTLFSVDTFISERYGLDAKFAIDFQFFLPKGVQIYSTFAYYFIYHDQVGKVNDLRFLAGMSFEYMKGFDFFMVPSLEYIFEDGNHTLSAGGLSQMFSMVGFMLFTNITFLEEGGIDPSVMARLTWTPNKTLSIQVQYTYVFKNIENKYPLRNSLSMRIRWQI